MQPNGSKAWFSISPDNAWIAFMEVDSTYPPPPNDEVPTRHLVTMELRTQSKTHHRLDGIPLGGFREGSTPWQDIEAVFEVDRWDGHAIYFELHWHRRIGGNPWVRFHAGIPPGEMASPPAGLRCSDCPPAELFASRLIGGLDQHDAEGDRLSIPFTKNQLSPFTYKVGSKKRNTIVRVDSVGNEVAVVTTRNTWWTKHFVRLRASPDERYMAYVIEVLPRVVVPFAGRHEVFLKDTRTGHVSRVRDDYDYVSGILWDSDSRRFYYAAMDFDGYGIYQVEVGE